MKLVLIGFFILMQTTISLCQYSYGNGKTDLVRREGFMKLSGWNFALGPTFMGNRLRNVRETLYNSGDTNYIVTHDPKSRIGLYAEIGRHKIFKYSRLFPYMDYGIAYKGLRGREVHEGEWLVSGEETPFETTDGEGEFANHNLLAFVNFNNILQLTNKLFIQNGIGANIDYSIIRRSTDIDGPFRTDVDLPRLWAQLHYKLGFGIKINDRFFIIPSIETPIVNFSPWTSFKTKVSKYMSTYRPLVVSVRFAFLSQKNVDCPPVYDPANGNNNDPAYR